MGGGKGAVYSRDPFFAPLALFPVHSSLLTVSSMPSRITEDKTDGSTVTYLYPPAGHTGGTVATVVDDSGVVYGVMNTYFGGPPNCFCAIRWDAAGNPAFLDSTYLAPK